MSRGTAALAMATLLLGAAWGQPPKADRLLNLQVDPPEASLELDGNQVLPRAGTYALNRKMFKSSSPVTPVLHAPGFNDLALPQVDVKGLAKYEPPGPLVLQPNSVRGYVRRYPFIFAILCLGGGWLGAAMLYKALRPTPQPPPVYLPPPPPAAAPGETSAAPEQPLDPLIGTELGPYTVIQHLGSGGMAKVYKAVPTHDPRESEAVAIKVIRPDYVSTESLVRFEREIRVCMKLNHPNVMRLIDWGQRDNLTYLVMEFIDGYPLNRYIPQGGLPLDQAMVFIMGIVEALAYAHSHEIVHRDLKPENVMVSKTGLVKLMDFGLARDQDVKTVTMMGAAMGTPAYMAPEQVMRGPNRAGLTDKSDQYALGILIFEILTGRRPFDWDDPIKLITMHLTEEPPAITSFRPDLPKGVERVVARMLSKEPDERFPTVKEAGESLLYAVDHPEEPEPPPTEEPS